MSTKELQQKRVKYHFRKIYRKNDIAKTGGTKRDNRRYLESGFIRYIHCLSVLPFSMTMLMTVMLFGLAAVFRLKLRFLFVNNLETIVDKLFYLMMVELTLDLLLTR
jgi:hypothetical protein